LVVQEGGEAVVDGPAEKKLETPHLEAVRVTDETKASPPSVATTTMWSARGARWR